jgi:lipopolysaccharide export system permease protein
VARFDRYLLSQLLKLFGFFALVLVALFWINRAVLLFDRLIGDGQSALVFLEFTALGLPRLITTVLPIAAFAGAAYVTNRMSTEAELTVLQATGSGPWRLARPVFVYGLCVALMLSVLSHFLVPLAQGQLSERESEISQNVTARLLTEGTFLHPTNQVTFYTGAIGADGVLRDVFLSDRRNAEKSVIYTAEEAYLVRNGEGTTLIMVDGTAQRLDRTAKTLSTAQFRDFSFDISALVDKDTPRALSLRAMTTPMLLGNLAAVEAETGDSRDVIVEELHSRFAQPLFSIVAAMIGFATLLVGGYSRFGVWREVAIAFGLLILIDGLRGKVSDIVRDDPDQWFMMYLPTAIGCLLIVAMLSHAAHPGWRARLHRRRAKP